MSETQEQKQARWDAEWKNALYGSGQGNPMATLCLHCYGRHKPPNDRECPNQPPRRDAGERHDTRKIL